MSKTNPFLINTYLKPKYFCGRDNETNVIIDFIKNKKSVFVKGNKGIGKSTFVKNAIYNLNKLAKYNFVVMDFRNILDYNNFLAHFFNSVLEINSDIDLENQETLYSTLEKFHSSLNEEKDKTYFILDNFDITDKKTSKKIEEFITEEITQKNYSFILSSNLKTLSFKFDEELELGAIDENEYKDFIKKHFKDSDIKIKSKTVKHLLIACENNPDSVQKLCNRLWNFNKNIDTDLIDETIENIVDEHQTDYLSIKNLLSEYQWKLVTAIAKEGIAIQFTSSDFIKKYSLNAPSSVKTATDALLEKEVIVKNNDDNYLLTDPFLTKWINRKF